MYTTIVDGIIPARSAAAASSGEKELLGHDESPFGTPIGLGREYKATLPTEDMVP